MSLHLASFGPIVLVSSLNLDDIRKVRRTIYSVVVHFLNMELV